MIRQVSSTPSWRVNRVLWPTIAGVEQHLVRRWPFAALLRELHVEVDGFGIRESARRASTLSLIPVDGSSLMTSWSGSVVDRR